MNLKKNHWKATLNNDEMELNVGLEITGVFNRIFVFLSLRHHFLTIFSNHGSKRVLSYGVLRIIFVEMKDDNSRFICNFGISLFKGLIEHRLEGGGAIVNIEKEPKLRI